MLASYACLAENTKGRVIPESSTPYRNEFERDRDRIIHSDAFKRLQYKTQVFVNHHPVFSRANNDHYRNRLTHSIEVSSIARSVSKALGLSDDLAEAVALAHDLGHSPFGHAGEDALNLCMKDFGGFSHNDHSFRILTFIEQKYAAYRGLNLSWEVIEGIAKHNGPIKDSKISDYMRQYDNQHKLQLDQFSSAEAQVASLADDIAYISHDLEDSINTEILTFDDLTEIEFVAAYLSEIQKQYKGVSKGRIIYEVVRKLTHRFIESLLFTTKSNIKEYNIQNIADIRSLGKPLVEFSHSTTQEIREIKAFLFRKVYKHSSVISVNLQCQKVIQKLFELYNENTELLPRGWQELIEKNDVNNSKQSVIAEYIAGMTDRFAIGQYQTFYNLTFSNVDL